MPKASWTKYIVRRGQGRQALHLAVLEHSRAEWRQRKQCAHSDQRSRDTENLLGCEGNLRAGLERDRLGGAPCEEDQDVERHHPVVGAACFVRAVQGAVPMRARFR